MNYPMKVGRRQTPDGWRQSLSPTCEGGSRSDSSFILHPSSFRRGFTLIELLVVIAIIAIILSFVLLAAMDTMHRAEIRQTQTLISKLESGLNDRLESLMQNRPQPNWTHGYLGAVWNTTYITRPVPDSRRYRPAQPADRGKPSGPRSSPGTIT